jgi:hypothetical protein
MMHKPRSHEWQAFALDAFILGCLTLLVAIKAADAAIFLGAAGPILGARICAASHGHGGGDPPKPGASGLERSGVHTLGRGVRALFWPARAA